MCTEFWQPYCSILSESVKARWTIAIFPLQCLAILAILVMITVFGYLQPYEDMYCNALEFVLSVNVLVLLLMRNTEQISDELQVLPQQTSNMTTVGTCRRAVEGVTGFSWLLFPFYYFPPVVFLTAGATWVTFNIRYVSTIPKFVIPCGPLSAQDQILHKLSVLNSN